MSFNGAHLRRTTELFQPCLVRKALKAPGEGTGPRTSQRPGKDSRCPNKSASCIRAVQNQGSVKGGSWTTSDGADDLDWFEDNLGSKQLQAQDIRRTQSGNSASSSGRYEPREGASVGAGRGSARRGPRNGQASRSQGGAAEGQGRWQGGGQGSGQGGRQASSREAGSREGPRAAAWAQKAVENAHSGGLPTEALNDGWDEWSSLTGVVREGSRTDDDLADNSLEENGIARSAQTAAAASSTSQEALIGTDVDIITGQRYSAAQTEVANEWNAIRSSGGSTSTSESAKPADDFLRAAHKLQARLVLGVRAEQDAGKEALMRLYRRENTRKLKASGNVLTNLVGSLDGRLFSNIIWRFSLDPLSPGAVKEGGPPGEAPGGGEQRPVLPELPYHRFSNGDGILVVSTLPNGELPKADLSQGLDSYASFEGTILEVRRGYVRAVFSRTNSDRMEERTSQGTWRFDRYSPETTYKRQLKAIFHLAVPWAAVEKAQGLKQVLGRGAGEEMLRRPEQLLREFRMGEERVRHIVLGSPLAPKLATTPPAWASDERWRKAARSVLGSLEGLNRSQQRAIATAMSSTFTLWQGPPGTGKTRTLLALLEVLSRISGEPGRPNAMGPILACADTNAATDNLVEGLVERGIDVTRLGQPAKVRESVRHASLEGKALKTVQGQEAQRLREQAEALFQKHRARGGHAAQRDQRLPQEERDALFELKKEGSRLWETANDLVQLASEQVLLRSQVVCATCAGAGDDERLQTYRYKMVIVDEATQATEPSNLIPLVRGAECVVMAGDPKQLPPTLMSDGALDAQLDRTLFDRLQDSGMGPMLLDTQYRMHPLIAEFPSERFYNGLLRSGISAQDRPLAKGVAWPNPGCPVMMVECEHGMEERSLGGQVNLARSPAQTPGAAQGSSYFNREEAILAIRAMVALMGAGDAESAAILTPYNGQVRLIRRILKEHTGELYSKVVVSSVDGYQGREADVIVFSAVRCNEMGSLGFVADPRRVNVAITRPRRGLVVVGSPKTLSSDTVWRSWIRWVRDHGAFLTANALPLCPWESPDDNLVSELDVSDLRPLEDIDPEGDVSTQRSQLIRSEALDGFIMTE